MLYLYLLPTDRWNLCYSSFPMNRRTDEYVNLTTPSLFVCPSSLYSLFSFLSPSPKDLPAKSTTTCMAGDDRERLDVDSSRTVECCVGTSTWFRHGLDAAWIFLIVASISAARRTPPPPTATTTTHRFRLRPLIDSIEQRHTNHGASRGTLHPPPSKARPVVGGEGLFRHSPLGIPVSR